MCIAGSMGFGSAGSKQRTGYIHSASSLCIAFPLWPPSVPLRPGSLPRRCCAAVLAQSSSHHSVIPLRLGAQLQTVSHVPSSCSYIHAACCKHLAWQHPWTIMRCMPTCSIGCQACTSQCISCCALLAINCTVIASKAIIEHPAAAAAAAAAASSPIKSCAWHFAENTCMPPVCASTNTRLSTCRPYLYTAIISAAVTVPFLLVKASIFDRPSYHPPAVFLFLDFLGFSLLHILVARKVVGWARNRYKLGLLGQSHPWQVSKLRCVSTDVKVPESGRAIVVWLLVSRQCINLFHRRHSGRTLALAA